MKRIFKLTLLAITIATETLLISSCQEDNKGVVPEDKTPKAPSGQVSDITFYTADITGKLELSKEELSQSEFGLLLSTSDDVMAVNSTKYPIKNFDKDYGYTLSLSGLDSVTTYYYRSYIYYDGNYIYSEVQNFTTKSPLDIIQTGNIESDSCTVKTFINSKNLLDHIQQYGISYGLNKLPLVATDSTVTTNAIGSDGRFTLKMRNIPFDTIVNYRAYVRVNNVDYYGPTLQFQGNTVRTGIINISDYTVKSHLKINDGYKELGVCYGMDSIPEIFDQKVSTTALNDSNDFKLKLVNIPFDTIVYYRAYALTGDSVYYGSINSFGGNTVTTGIIDTITFQIQSSVRFNDGISEYGVCYSNSEIPVTFDKKVSVQQLDSAGCYTLSLTNIPFGTVYYRSYVIKDDIAYYGDIRKFEGNGITTGNFNAESLKAQSILRFSNSYDNPELGICYSNNQEPTIADKHVLTTVSDTTCTYELLLRNMPFGTVYYRAYMMYDGFPVYGEIKQIEGNTVTTSTFIDNTLTANSSIKYSIGYDELNLGVCYSNNTTPTINDKVITANSVDSINSFALQLTEIPFGKVYYRSYMMYEGVPQYGDVKSFDGNVITTGSFNENTLIANSNLKFSAGYKNLDLGVCYSTNEQPTINDKKVTTTSVDSLNAFALQLTEIPFGKVYYRSYMMYEDTPQYGDVKSFEGNSITTGSFADDALTAKSSIKYSTGYNMLDLGVCYSTNEQPTINDKKVSTSSVDSLNSFALQLTEIPFGKVYYRSYMIFEDSPYYGEVKSFEGNAITTGSFIDSSLVANASLKFSTGYKELDLGICYGTSEQPTINDKKVTTSSVDSLNSFALGLIEVPFGKVYYRSYMMYEGKPQYGAVKSFEGNAITTGECDTTTYRITTTIKITKGYESLDMGICYSDQTEPTINDNKISTNAFDSDNSYSVQFEGVPFGKVYYRSFMMFEGKPQYGAVKSFDGNSITTGDYDQQSLSVTSHVKIKENFDQLSYGVCYSTNTVPMVSDKTISTTELDSKNDFTVMLTKNSVGSTIYYRAYIKRNGVIYYGDVKSFKKQLTVDIVDLGLSVKWASFNIGADYPEDYGEYYAWGETNIKDTYYWPSYTYRYSGTEYENILISKYNTDEILGQVDNQITLEPDDDVANLKWGGDWRMPSKAEYDELLNNCTWEWTRINGVRGYKITSKKSGYNNSSIFLPAAGSRISTRQNYVGEEGFYWSSTLYIDDPRSAIKFDFGSGRKGIHYDGRYCGFSVRPVCQSESWLSSTTIELSEITRTIIPNKSFDLNAVIKHQGEIFDAQIKWTSDNPSVATVDVNGKVKTKSKGTAHITATYSSLSAQCTVVVGEESDITHEYVDLGLSVKWATYNVGAISEVEYGDYFAWGEIESKSTYSWGNYYYRASGTTYEELTFSKYNNTESRGTIDNKFTLDFEDDVAHIKWGGNWRMPTKEEIDELLNWDNCNREVTTINGVRGCKITGNKPGCEGNYIFLPSAGYISDNTLNYVGDYGWYWTNTLTEVPTSSWIIWIDNSAQAASGSRGEGHSVRPVCP